MRLHYPVHTPDNQLLLPAGAVLSAETLDDLISYNRATSYQTCSFLEYGMVKHDLLRQINRPPYDVIFSGQDKIAEVITMLEQIQFVIPVLQALNYFKRDDYHTYCHALVVCALSALIAKDLLPDYGERINVVSAGPTHDIGKICISSNILKKATPLTRAERSIIDYHSTAGYVLLSFFNREYKNLVPIVARDHHERKDGSGMPYGIKLSDRAVEIIVVCDIYDALISPRPYRSVAYDNRTALEEITKLAENNKIGWEGVQSLVAHNRRAKPRPGEVKVSIEKRGTVPLVNSYGVVEDSDSYSR